jgi:hypothetical protein
LKVTLEVLEITDKNVYGKYFKLQATGFSTTFLQKLNKIRSFGRATIYTSVTLFKI